MKIRCLIIDDEPLARKGLENYINEVDYLELVDSFSNPVQSLETLDSEKIDLVFLDIQMPKITGLEFLKSINHPAKFVFTTAYPNFAIDSYELNALDYLLKPISFERFLKTVTKVKNQLELENKTTFQIQKDYIYVKSDSKIEKIELNSIIFIQSLENYVVIQTNEKKHICYLTLKNVESFLPSKDFIKVQKSYIINLNRINSIEGNTINIDKFQVPISRNLKDDVLKIILSNKYLKR